MKNASTIKIAILYICTGEYVKLWPEFYRSMENFFCENSLIDYYIFSDIKELENKEVNSRIHFIYQSHTNWLYSTLLRFSMFCSIEKELLGYQYVFFFNANTMVLENITEDMIIPRKSKGEKLVFVKHPTYNWSVLEDPYDRNPFCRAYVPYGIGKVYVQACILGGETKAFLKMSKKLAKQIDKDIKNGVIALWHDESYVNRYILFRKDYRLLGREYSRQNISSNGDNIILMRDKKQYFDVDTIKNVEYSTKYPKWFDKYDYYTKTLAERIIEFKKRLTK